MIDRPQGFPGWTVLRITLAALLAAHGWMRLLGGGVAPFGTWLTAQGVPFGTVVAAGITGFEIVGTVLLALGRFVLPLTVAHALILLGGIALVHAPEGWFVVGAGRNGVEYSVLLIVTLLCVGLQDAQGRR